jgi:hypothetical protein
MTDEEKEEFNANERLIDRMADEEFGKMWDKMIHTIDQDQAENIKHIMQSGNTKEIEILINGMVDAYGSNE